MKSGGGKRTKRTRYRFGSAKESGGHNGGRRSVFDFLDSSADRDASEWRRRRSSRANDDAEESSFASPSASPGRPRSGTSFGSTSSSQSDDDDEAASGGGGKRRYGAGANESGDRRSRSVFDFLDSSEDLSADQDTIMSRAERRRRRSSRLNPVWFRDEANNDSDDSDVEVLRDVDTVQVRIDAGRDDAIAVGDEEDSSEGGEEEPRRKRTRLSNNEAAAEGEDAQAAAGEGAQVPAPEGPPAPSELRRWLRRLDAANGSNRGRFESYAPAFEREFDSLEDLALAADGAPEGLEGMLRACGVGAFGDRARLRWALAALPRPGPAIPAVYGV